MPTKERHWGVIGFPEIGPQALVGMLKADSRRQRSLTFTL